MIKVEEEEVELGRVLMPVLQDVLLLGMCCREFGHGATSDRSLSISIRPL